MLQEIRETTVNSKNDNMALRAYNVVMCDTTDNCNNKNGEVRKLYIYNISVFFMSLLTFLVITSTRDFKDQLTNENQIK